MKPKRVTTTPLRHIEGKGRTHLVHDILAEIIGVDEAIVLNQIAFLSMTYDLRHDGRRWCPMPLHRWREMLPYYSASTLRRVLDALKEKGLVDSRTDLNRSKWDRTCWYSINEEGLREVGYEFTGALQPTAPAKPKHLPLSASIYNPSAHKPPPATLAEVLEILK